MVWFHNGLSLGILNGTMFLRGGITRTWILHELCLYMLMSLFTFEDICKLRYILNKIPTKAAKKTP